MRSSSVSGKEPADLTELLSLPSAVSTALEHFRPLLSAADFQRLCETLDQELPAAIRINLLKHEPKDFIHQLEQRYGWQLSAVPFCPSGWNLDASAGSIAKTSEHLLGDYYIQESASMLPVELFDLSGQPSPLVLDMAASPGGKTTHLIDKTADRGLVIANDASSGRIAALRVVLAKWGAINQAVTCLHGEYFGSQLPETFDIVLLDAPCSMQNLYDTPSHPLRAVSPGEQQSLSNRQFLLLRSALQTVKVGGQVVYSTCTLSPEEDEMVVQRALQEFGDRIRLDDGSARLPKPAPALNQFGNQCFAPAMQRAVRLWPHLFGTTGFFSARFTKLASIPSETGGKPAQTGKRVERANPLSPKDQQTLSGWMRDLYGFDLESVLQKQQDLLMENGNGILLAPERLFSEFFSLPFSSYGMNAFKRIPGGFQISHEFAARFGISFQQGCVVLNEEQSRAYWGRQDIFDISIRKDWMGETLLVKDESGRVLGRAKALKDRLKNLLPTRLY
jgi:16S rRNA (cytosine1407-C5)-methyltransferase